MPVVGGLYTISEPLIGVLMGERWLPAAELFSILAIAAFLQTTSGFRGTVLMSLGMGRRYLMQGLYSAIVTCAGFIIGIRWGASGVATAYAVTSLIMPYPMHVYSFKGTPLKVSDFLEPIAAPAFAAIGAAIAVAAISAFLIPNLSAVANLISGTLLYAICYTGSLWAYPPSRKRLRQTISFLTETFAKRRKAAPASLS